MNLPPGLEDIDFDDLLLDDPLFQDLKKKEDQHKCCVFGPLHKGKLEIVDKKPKYFEIPSKVEGFVGRQREIFEVVSSILANRLVTIIGLPGIGKTSLSKNAVHYLATRRVFKAGIVFMSLKGFINCEIFLKKLLTNLIMLNSNRDKNEVENANAEKLLLMALHYLKQQEEEVLIVFDNVEDLLYHDKLAFRTLVNDVLN